jgi:hypothetical protein
MSAVTTAGTAPLRTAPLISWALTWATARRVLAQLRHDPRTVAMMLAVPAVLMILLRYVLNNPLAQPLRARIHRRLPLSLDSRRTSLGVFARRAGRPWRCFCW